jgi:pyruvate/2-oxoglutarate dehydrogenase complex dihydrolipoamide acyltransferase (E2) component
MAEITIRIPRSSPDSTEATLIEQLVAEGARVAEGEPLFTIATEKVESEIEAPASGTVHWTSEVEVDYEIGAEIGVIRSED